PKDGLPFLWRRPADGARAAERGSVTHRKAGRPRKGLVTFPPLQVELVGVEPAAAEGRADRPDVYIDIRLASKAYRFVAAVRVQTTPKSFREALDRIERAAAARERRPMIVTPYLSPERLNELEERGISGVDLSGNGIVVIPGEMFVRRTGEPNRFPTGRRIP
ncbi:MAG: hypothetical protein SGJ11_17220, partial [Phycisphaerae bacterium]|nr:hypothetical protein [Phycisphaerae bacterium]